MPFGDLKNDRRVMLGRAYGSLAGVAYGFSESSESCGSYTYFELR